VSERAGIPVTGYAVGLALVGLVVALFWMGEPVEPPLGRGDPAPAFDLPRLDGGRIALRDLRGGVALVNFWATWCKPCEDEMPAMQRLYETLAPEGFEMVAISVDESAEDVEAFRERLGVGFPILLDPDQSVSRRYQTTGFPESLLVDRDGRIIERYVGPREWDHPDYVARVRRLLE
jgi:peroxiredoxin